jgi:hypothetical protein
MLRCAMLCVMRQARLTRGDGLAVVVPRRASGPGKQGTRWKDFQGVPPPDFKSVQGVARAAGQATRRASSGAGPSSSDAAAEHTQSPRRASSSPLSASDVLGCAAPVCAPRGAARPGRRESAQRAGAMQPLSAAAPLPAPLDTGTRDTARKGPVTSATADGARQLVRQITEPKRLPPPADSGGSSSCRRASRRASMPLDLEAASSRPRSASVFKV